MKNHKRKLGTTEEENVIIWRNWVTRWSLIARRRSSQMKCWVTPILKARADRTFSTDKLSERKTLTPGPWMKALKELNISHF